MDSQRYYKVVKNRLGGWDGGELEQMKKKHIHSYNKIMLSSSSRNIQNLITQLLIDGRYRQAIEKGLKEYQIKQFKVDSLPPNQIFSMYYSLSTKFYDSKPHANQESWYQNELRIFIWVLVGYSYLEDRCVSKMTDQDWQFFSHIFNNRSPEIFQFQALSILKKEVKFVKWTEEQITLLDSIIKAKKIKNKWNEIAKELFLCSQKRYFRTAKQCREHWINHLDPKPIRSVWKLSEDIELVEAVKVVGKRWAKVSKMLQGTRTEHMVKNRFKSLEHLQFKILTNSNLKNPKDEEVIIELERRLLAEHLAETSKMSTEKKKQMQINKNATDIKFQSAEAPSNDVGQEGNRQMEENLLLDFDDQNNEEDQLLKFTLNMQTIQSFRNIYDDYQCKALQEKQECGGQNFSNFFEHEYNFH